ncbi:MAG TPA: hypothetical protein VL354_19760, partial [Spirochaetia bacterium]|nr:hypothetical protein [Spirochaetia bacterium]
SLVPAEVRHRLARTIIDTFDPFFAYSPIALGTDLDGEANLGRLFTLNPELPMHAFYIAGSDHYRRRNEVGRPDTIEKLEGIVQRLREHNDERHCVSAVFVDRPGEGGAPGPIGTSLDVRFLPAVPVICSSSAARHALCTGEFTDALAFLPYAELAEINSLGIYEGSRACQEDYGPALSTM